MFRINCLRLLMPFSNIIYAYTVSILGLLCAVIVSLLLSVIAIVFCMQLFPTGKTVPNQHL